MAWRLHDRVVRGEIDNRQRGHVRGKIWLIGRPDRIALDLTGNCWPDLAGGVAAAEKVAAKKLIEAERLSAFRKGMV